MEPVAFTTRSERLASELVTPCHVGAANGNPIRLSDCVALNALWDTGATASVISAEVAEKLNLSPHFTVQDISRARGEHRECVPR